MNVSVQSLSCVQLFATPWTAACQASLSITNSRSLFRLMSIESVMPSKQLILCRPLLPPSIFPILCRPLLPPSIFPSIRSVLHISCPKYRSFSFSISPSNKYSGLISFRIDWLDELAVQGTLKSLLQHHSSKASIPCSAFFMVQLSHPYMTTGKIISLTRWGIPCSSVGKESSCNGMRPQFDSWVGKICWRRNRLPIPVFLGFPGGSAGKESTWNSGDLGLIPGLGRLPGEGKGPPLQCSGLENSMDGIVHWIAKSQT